ncbi:hypothetical protein [Bathymodiolus thermophilus thioautotrophic gill symbiont]|nr:hypothetical protein [Bathymodiolus thermophilus thioautotrophic gill symbiont]
MQSLKDGDCDSKPLAVNNLLFVDSFTSRYNTTNATTTLAASSTVQTRF